MKTKYTLELQESICKALRRGMYLETAAALSDVSKAQLYEWLKRGKQQPDGVYGTLPDAVEKAIAEGEARDLDTIDEAAQQGQWQAAAWRLERRAPSRWGRKDRVKVEAEQAAEARVGEIPFGWSADDEGV